MSTEKDRHIVHLSEEGTIEPRTVESSIPSGQKGIHSLFDEPKGTEEGQYEHFGRNEEREGLFCSPENDIQDSSRTCHSEGHVSKELLEQGERLDKQIYGTVCKQNSLQNWIDLFVSVNQVDETEVNVSDITRACELVSGLEIEDEMMAEQLFDLGATLRKGDSGILAKIDMNSLVFHYRLPALYRPDPRAWVTKDSAKNEIHKEYIM